MRSAVSASPLRAPWVEMKYSSTVSPSLKEERIGSSMIRPDGSDMSPRKPAIWRICAMFPFAPELDIIASGPSGSRESVRSFCISAVVSVQTLIAAARFSPAVTSPIWNCSSMASMLRSDSPISRALSRGTEMSELEIVRPDCVA